MFSFLFLINHVLNFESTKKEPGSFSVIVSYLQKKCWIIFNQHLFLFSRNIFPITSAVTQYLFQSIYSQKHDGQVSYLLFAKGVEFDPFKYVRKNLPGPIPNKFVL